MIDGDALIKDIEEFWDWNTVDGITATTVLRQTITDIRNAPTVEAVPVVHGRWELVKLWTGFESLYCSECNYETNIASNYCPFCGARMDGNG